jgi:AcrR family transcriptional regulator
VYRSSRAWLSTGYAGKVPTGETRTSYHHGSLRDELITACVALIESEGIGAVSLRRVARAAGVSPGAPYHHFPDRSALLTAISVQGYEMLERRLREARAQAPTGARALGALVVSYVDFARAHPAHLQLMFRPELSEPDKHPEAHAACDAVLQVLTEIVEDCQREGTAPPGDPSALVGMVWALAVGLVTLWLDGPLEADLVSLGTTPERMTADIAALLENMLFSSSQRRTATG